MDNKVLCPYCGAEMSVSIGEDEPDYNAWTVCTRNGCTAEGPLVTGYETSEEAEEAAIAAALRRYTPPIKPMPLEKVLATDAEVFMEANGDYGVWACRCFVYMHGKAVIVHYIDSLDDIHRFADYGKTWRCWERKPTDEERRAAEWKD